MDDAAWLSSTDPHALLGHVRGKRHNRKLRLFNLAQADRLRRHPQDEKRWRRFRPIAEQLADDPRDKRLRARFRRLGDKLFADMDYAWTGFLETHDIAWVEAESVDWLEQWAGRDLPYHCSECYPREEGSEQPAWDAAADVVRVMVEFAVRKAGLLYMQANGLDVKKEGEDLEARVLAAVRPEAEALARADQCRWLREVFGNPFRPATVEPGWRSEDVLKVARGVYEEKAWDRLPVLADALLDAGCDSRDLLDHLKSPGPHARGCWALDAVLEKA
jgi:hypothetical protein